MSKCYVRYNRTIDVDWDNLSQTADSLTPEEMYEWFRKKHPRGPIMSDAQCRQYILSACRNCFNFCRGRNLFLARAAEIKFESEIYWRKHTKFWKIRSSIFNGVFDSKKISKKCLFSQRISLSNLISAASEINFCRGRNQNSFDTRTCSLWWKLTLRRSTFS